MLPWWCIAPYCWIPTDLQCILLWSNEIGHISEYRIIWRKTPELLANRNKHNQKNPFLCKLCRVSKINMIQPGTICFPAQWVIIFNKYGKGEWFLVHEQEATAKNVDSVLGRAGSHCGLYWETATAQQYVVGHLCFPCCLKERVRLLCAYLIHFANIDNVIHNMMAL